MRKFKSWVAGLSKTGKILLIGLTAFGLLTIASAASSSDSDKIELAANEKDSQQVESAGTKPTIETKTLTETIEIPFESTTINDSGLEKGKTEIRTVGVNGVKTLPTSRLTPVESRAKRCWLKKRLRRNRLRK